MGSEEYQYKGILTLLGYKGFSVSELVTPERIAYFPKLSLCLPRVFGLID